MARAAGLLVHLAAQEPRSDQRRDPEGRLQVDARIEVYSMGILGHYVLTGTLPFHGPTVAAILAQHLMRPARHVATKGHPPRSYPGSASSAGHARGLPRLALVVSRE